MSLLAAFVDYLTHERRMAEKTVEAYRSDLAGFFGFLTQHRGETPTPDTFSRLRARDVRSFLAHRRRDGLADASIARLLSSIKAFYRWLGRAHDIENAEIAYLQGPRRPQRLPRPVSVDAAKDLIEEAETEPDQPAWINARDAAVLSLLYGAGLRISEALGLTGADLPMPERLRILGKGGKVRIVPLIPAVREAVESYAAICPYQLGRDDALFRGAKGGALNPRLIQRLVQRLRTVLSLPETATPHALRHAFATHLLANGAGFARDPDAAGPCIAVNDTSLYWHRRGPVARRPCGGPSARLRLISLKSACCARNLAAIASDDSQCLMQGVSPWARHAMQFSDCSHWARLLAVA